MAQRANKRVANRKVNAATADIAKKKAQRMSVGGALGLTPRKPKGKNLHEAMAEEAAVAAAARLDGFSDAESPSARSAESPLRPTIAGKATSPARAPPWL